MAKGRRFVPSKEKEGNWFRTRGWPRRLDDSKPPEKSIPSPPRRFDDKHEVPFQRFSFSSHDNRHAFQDQGEYFGNLTPCRLSSMDLDPCLGCFKSRSCVCTSYFMGQNECALAWKLGLGRRTFPDRCQHYSNNLITWSADSDARSCYMASYQGAPGADNNRYRRFPRVHPEAKPSSAPLATTTTKWFQRPDVPYNTPLHVLAITQEPFLSPNKWVYSYRPIWH